MKLDHAPTVASDGRDFLVSWTNCAKTKRLVIASRIVDGEIADRIAISAGSMDAESGGAVWDGRNYVAYITFSP